MSDTSLNSIIQYGTAAARAAFTPSPAAGSKVLYIWYDTDAAPATWIWDGSAWVQINATAASGTVVYPSRCEGRITLESGVPVSTSDQTAKTNIYWTPCDSACKPITNGVISLWNGSALVDVAVTEITKAVGTLTSGKNYDFFVDYNGGTPQGVFSAAWTTDIARADALGTQYDSTRKETIIIKSGTAAYRWVGTFRTTATTTTEDSLAKRFIWNAYNQVARVMQGATETTDSWNYTLAAFHQANANAANQLAYVTGEVSVEVEALVTAIHACSVAQNAMNAIGVDSTTVASGFRNFGSTTSVQPSSASYRGTPGLGYHFLAWLEYSQASGTTTWYGDAGDATVYQSGINGIISRA